ncbi:MAG TPA: leucine-rich repeat domain-containing protein [Rhabdochlamydiaceae bacterium]|jgi:Leucine-rich repeat (LRR) protein
MATAALSNIQKITPYVVLNSVDSSPLKQRRKKSIESHEEALNQNPTGPKIQHRRYNSVVELNLVGSHLLLTEAQLICFTGLKALRMPNMGLKKIPGVVGALIVLEELDVSGNKIKEITRNIIFCRSMKRLFLQDNAIMQLGDEVAALKNLEEVNFSDNSVEEFPLCLKNLSHLQIVNAAGNHIEKVPHFLKEMRSLKKLDVRENPLIKISSRAVFFLAKKCQLQSLLIDGSHLRLFDPELCFKLQNRQVIEGVFKRTLSMMPIGGLWD